MRILQPFRFFTLVFVLGLALSSAGVTHAAKRSLIQTAEKELEIKTGVPNADAIRYPLGSATTSQLSESSSFVRVGDVSPLKPVREKLWSAGLILQSYTPSGTLDIVTGDRFDLSQSRATPMAGLEVTRTLFQVDSRAHLSLWGSASYANQVNQLKLGSGQVLNDIRLNTFLVSAGLSLMLQPLTSLPFELGVQAGRVYQITTQSGPNSVAKGQTQAWHTAGGPKVLVRLPAQFFLSSSYLFVRSSKNPSNQLIFSAGVEF